MSSATQNTINFSEAFIVTLTQAEAESLNAILAHSSSVVLADAGLYDFSTKLRAAVGSLGASDYEVKA